VSGEQIYPRVSPVLLEATKCGQYTSLLYNSSRKYTIIDGYCPHFTKVVQFYSAPMRNQRLAWNPLTSTPILTDDTPFTDIKVSDGTFAHAFEETIETDGPNQKSHYQSITCMPVYHQASFEELRSQDYSMGLKNSSSFPPVTSTAEPTSSTGLPVNQLDTFKATETIGFTTTSSYPWLSRISSADNIFRYSLHRVRGGGGKGSRHQRHIAVPIHRLYASAHQFFSRRATGV
jgi:hypothetical protein